MWAYWETADALLHAVPYQPESVIYPYHRKQFKNHICQSVYLPLVSLTAVRISFDRFSAKKAIGYERKNGNGRASYCMAAFVCESFAHDLRMGYVRYYVRSDVRLLSGLRAGEEQSAMQNELSDISNYFRENLFSFLKQFVTFAVTFLFLLHRNWKLTLLSTVPKHSPKD